MKSFFIVLGIASLMGFATCAHASGELVSTEGYEMCHRMAELAELSDVADGETLLGDTYERVQADCELAELMWEVGSLNETIDADMSLGDQLVGPIARSERIVMIERAGKCGAAGRSCE